MAKGKGMRTVEGLWKTSEREREREGECYSLLLFNKRG